MKNRIIKVQTARKLRRESTEAEKILWNEFRNRKFRNLKIRRQHPIGDYVVDFYCCEKKVIIEVDGSIHEDIEQREYDVKRQSELEELGNRVIRLRNEDVFKDVKGVLEKIVI